MTASPLRFDQLIRSVGGRDFFQTYWQRRPLSLELDKATFAQVLAEIGTLDIVSLAKKTRQGAQAWISGPDIAHSVFEADASTVADFHRVGATLYFVDVAVPHITEPVADALGAPRWRMRASLFLTPPGSGASPHFDCNENFTIQLTGAKRWFVGAEPLAAVPTIGHFLGDRVPPALDGMIAPAVPAEQSFNLKPGRLLYVPRGTVHRTEANVESWSLNICYSGTTWLELLQDGLKRKLIASPRWRATVSGASATSSPEAQTANILPELVAELRQMLDEPEVLDEFCRAFLAPGKV